MKQLDRRVHNITVHNSIGNESSHQRVAATRGTHKRLARGHDEGENAASDDAKSVDGANSNRTVDELKD